MQPDELYVYASPNYHVRSGALRVAQLRGASITMYGGIYAGVHITCT
jgi:hypothetical protein